MYVEEDIRHYVIVILVVLFIKECNSTSKDIFRNNVGVTFQNQNKLVTEFVDKWKVTFILQTNDVETFKPKENKLQQWLAWRTQMKTPAVKTTKQTEQMDTYVLSHQLTKSLAIQVDKNYEYFEEQYIKLLDEIHASIPELDRETEGVIARNKRSLSHWFNLANLQDIKRIEQEIRRVQLAHEKSDKTFEVQTRELAAHISVENEEIGRLAKSEKLLTRKINQFSNNISNELDLILEQQTKIIAYANEHLLDLTQVINSLAQLRLAVSDLINQRLTVQAIPVKHVRKILTQVSKALSVRSHDLMIKTELKDFYNLKSFHTYQSEGKIYVLVELPIFKRSSILDLYKVIKHSLPISESNRDLRTELDIGNNHFLALNSDSKKFMILSKTDVNTCKLIQGITVCEGQTMMSPPHTDCLIAIIDDKLDSIHSLCNFKVFNRSKDYSETIKLTDTVLFISNREYVRLKCQDNKIREIKACKNKACLVQIHNPCHCIIENTGQILNRDESCTLSEFNTEQYELTNVAVIMHFLNDFDKINLTAKLNKNQNWNYKLPKIKINTKEVNSIIADTQTQKANLAKLVTNIKSGNKLLHLNTENLIAFSNDKDWWTFNFDLTDILAYVMITVLAIGLALLFKRTHTAVIFAKLSSGVKGQQLNEPLFTESPGLNEIDIEFYLNHMVRIGIIVIICIVCIMVIKCIVKCIGKHCCNFQKCKLIAIKNEISCNLELIAIFRVMDKTVTIPFQTLKDVMCSDLHTTGLNGYFKAQITTVIPCILYRLTLENSDVTNKMIHFHTIKGQRMLSNNCLVNRRTAMRIMKVCNRKTCEVTLAYKCKNTLIPVVQNDVFPKPPKRRLEPPEVPPRNVSLHTYVPTSTPKNSKNMPCSPIVNRSDKHSFDKSNQSKRKIKRPTKLTFTNELRNQTEAMLPPPTPQNEYKTLKELAEDKFGNEKRLTKITTEL